MNYHSSKLDAFISYVDENYGDISNYPKTEFVLEFDTKIDLNIDPFSNTYFEMQFNLYKEISGRQINQELNEQFERDAQSTNSVLTHAVNPLGRNDVTYLATHMRAISAMLEIGNIPPGGAILDVGAGWGLTSELIAFAGGNVTAIDINPEFTQLISQRAARLNLAMKAVTSNFDTFSTSEKFDAVIFYESLHHAIYPLELLRTYSKFLKPGGKILFCGEPINNRWPDWGLRTDAESVYVMRKYGWFESGWSEKYLIDLFRFAGLQLKLLPWSGLRNGYIGIAMDHKSFTTDAFNLGEGSPANLFEIYKSSQKEGANRADFLVKLKIEN